MKVRFYEFGPFQIDKLNHVLLRDGVTLPLKPKVFDTLLLLLENRERVLDKDELLRRLWPETVVEESNLSQNVYLLRKVLGEEAAGEIYIATMPKRGYRFVASVKEVEGAVNDKLSEPQTFDADKKNSSVVEAEHLNHPKLQRASSNYALSSRRVGALAIGGLIIVCGLASAIYLWSRSKSTSLNSRSPINSIAVLPFKPLGTA